MIERDGNLPRFNELLDERDRAHRVLSMRLPLRQVTATPGAAGDGGMMRATSTLAGRSAQQLVTANGFRR